MCTQYSAYPYIEKKIKEETSELDEFRTRCAQGGSPIRWGDWDEEEHEWRRPAVERLEKKSR